MVTSQTKLRVTTLYPKSGDMAGQTGNIRTPLRPSGQQAMGQSTATVIKNYADSIPENVIKFGRAILSNIVKFPDDIVKFPDDIVKFPDDIVKFPDDIVKFPDNESDTEHKAASKKGEGRIQKNHLFLILHLHLLERNPKLWPLKSVKEHISFPKDVSFPKTGII